MDVEQIQDTISDVDATLQEETELRVKKSLVTRKIKYVIQMVLACFTVLSPVRRSQDDRRGAVRDIELGMVQTVVSNEEDGDSNEVGQSAGPNLQLNQSMVTSNSKIVIQVTVALVFLGGSFALVYSVPGGVNELGRAVMVGTIAFNVCLVAVTLTFLTSLAVTMIVATIPHISANMEYIIRISLWAAAVFFVLTFLAAGYVVVFPIHK